MRPDTPRDIPLHEVKFHPMSYGDPDGRVFRWRGGLYRGVRAAGSRWIRSLIDRGVLEDLVRRDLFAATHPTSLRLAGFDLILELDEVPRVTYPTEWCAPMLRDAGLALLDVEAVLSTHGCTLKDGHPWNVVFDAGRPRVVDVGSIAPATPGRTWPAEEEFRRFFVFPLMLMAAGHDYVARCLLQDDRRGVLPSDLTGMLGLRAAWTRATLAVSRRLPGDAAGRIGRALRRRLVRTLPDARPDLDPVPTALHGADEDGDVVRRVVAARHPASVLVFGADDRVSIDEATRGGVMAIVVEPDPLRAADLYESATGGRGQVSPVVMSLRSPTPGLGVVNEEFTPAAERLASDLVICGAAARRQLTDQSLTSGHISATLRRFAARWALVAGLSSVTDDLLDVLKREWADVVVLQAGGNARFYLCSASPADAGPFQ